MQKYLNLDIRKTWRGIFIDYIETSKHLRVWVPHTHQVLIASQLIINEGKKDANLLIEHLLSPVKKPLQLQTGESKPRG